VIRKIFANQRWLAVGAVLLGWILFSIILERCLTPGIGIDWRLTYRPATLAFWQGKNPYDPALSPQAPFYAAPWGLILLAPFLWLPEGIGVALLVIGGLIVCAMAAIRMRAKPLAMAAFLLAPPVVHGMMNANIEWIPILGFTLPPPIGIFFVTVKPQTGFAVVLFWVWEAWRNERWRGVAKLTIPISGAFLISFLAYGLWPMRVQNLVQQNLYFNASLWPISIPVGMVLIVAAFRQRNIRFAFPASACFSPYVLFHSWSGALFALVGLPAEALAASIGLWIVILLRLL
jgi:hypothetical protein